MAAGLANFCGRGLLPSLKWSWCEVPPMSEAVAYKVRCAACGKSLRVTAADAGTQMLCRACGTRLEVPATSLVDGDVEQLLWPVHQPASEVARVDLPEEPGVLVRSPGEG